MAAETRDAEGREHVIHRLEAFSDIVIGFSLAQLGLNLVLPQHAIDFVQRPIGTVAFIVTFFVIVRFWWTHFRIFRSYFEPNRIMITLNFCALAVLILQVFSLQLYLHFVPLGQGMAASRIYFGLFLFSYGLLGAMFVLGLVYRRKILTVRQRFTGIRDAFGIFGVVVGGALGNDASNKDVTNVVVAVSKHSELVAVAPSKMILGMFVGWIVGIALGRLTPLAVRLFQTARLARKRDAV